MHVPDTVVTALGNDRWLLDNGQLSLTVDGGRGGDIVSAVLRGIETEMMWRDGEELRVPGISDKDASFYDGYGGGMQELFPNAGPATVVHGAPLPFHGEACRVPWGAVVADGALTMRVALRRYPFELQRRISLRPGEAVVDVVSLVTNTSRRELPVHWGLHPVFAEQVTAAPAIVFGAFRNPIADTTIFGPSQSVKPGAAMPMGEWGGRPVLPLFDANAGTSDLGYTTVEDGWFVVRSGRTGLAVGMTWPTSLFPDLWIWQECGSPARYPWWGRQHLVGIEPHSSSPSRSLLDEVEDGAAMLVQGGGTISAEYSLRFAKLADSELLAFVDLTASGAQAQRREQER